MTSLDYWIFTINFFIVPKIALLILHYANKVHLIIFNLVFVDAAWQIGRSVLHSQDMPMLDNLITYTLMIMVTYDFARYAWCILYSHAWKVATDKEKQFKVKSSE